MTFLSVNNSTVKHRLLDIMKDRCTGKLRPYFEQYSLSAHKTIQTITVNLFTHSPKLIKYLSPNSKIIADKFHVVMQVYTAFNKTRIKVMNDLGATCPEYRQLKKIWKLVLKDEINLDYTTRKKYINFQRAFLTNQDVIDRLLTLSV